MNTTSSPLDNITRASCGVFSDDPYREAKLFNFSLTVFISVFGLISNSVVIAVNRRIKKPSSTDVYIMLLAITDNLVLLSTSLFAYRYVYRHLVPEKYYSMYYSLLTALFGILFKTFAQSLNTYTILLLNIDRYILVKYNVLSKTWCTPRRAVIHFIFIVIGSLIFSVPKFIEYIPAIRNEKNAKHCEGYFKMLVGIGAERSYMVGYRIVAFVIIMYVIPLTILTITNISLISNVVRRRKWLNRIRSEASEKEGMTRSEMNVVITLIAVTLIFMVCQIPDMIVQAIWKLARQHGPTANIFVYQIIIINSSINFIIYAISSSVFRNRLRKTFMNRTELESTTT